MLTEVGLGLWERGRSELSWCLADRRIRVGRWWPASSRGRRHRGAWRWHLGLLSLLSRRSRCVPARRRNASLWWCTVGGRSGWRRHGSSHGRRSIRVGRRRRRSEGQRPRLWRAYKRRRNTRRSRSCLWWWRRGSSRAARWCTVRALRWCRTGRLLAREW